MSNILPINLTGPTLTKLFLALKNYLGKHGKESEKVLVRVLNIMQGQHYIQACERNPSQEQFFYGWIANRVSL